MVIYLGRAFLCGLSFISVDTQPRYIVVGISGESFPARES
jgi:hypothetical protein